MCYSEPSFYDKKMSMVLSEQMLPILVSWHWSQGVPSTHLSCAPLAQAFLDAWIFVFTKKMYKKKIKVQL